VLENACNGAYKLLYVSPERLFTDVMKERLKRMEINLVAVDEAHCISQWGYDFRPPYLKISSLRSEFNKAPILAVTATATQEVVEDIQEKLEFSEKHVIKQSFLRPNLSYSVLYENRKREKLLGILKSVAGSGIVYMRSRGECKEISEWLLKNNIAADFYHAGLNTEERTKKQQAWMNGTTRIIVSTNAFGMGIDKPDVRLVVHLAMPDNLEAYFQEAGRAGRDGEKAFSVLLYQESDADRLRQFLDVSYPELDFVKRVYRGIGAYTQLAIGAGLGESFDFDLPEFCSRFKFQAAPTHAAIRLLAQEGLISLNESAAAPARVHITASREVLYDYQIRNKQADILLKMLLRAYPGIQHDLVPISELSVARMCNSTPESVQKVLILAQKEDILEYQPALDKPQLVFTRERLNSDDMHIDLEAFSFRKNRAQQRTEAAIGYAETRRCRSQQLLAYFGEKGSAPCGICDICTGRNKPDESQVLIEQYIKKVQLVLHDEGLEPDEILTAFAPKRRDLVLAAIQYMLDEGMLLEADEKLMLPPKSGKD
jgi:ATP-dependent DNA helicase RecQ